MTVAGGGDVAADGRNTAGLNRFGSSGELGFGLDGRVAVVTGAAQGIGAAVAHRLADYGATVVVLDRVTADATADAVIGRGGRAVSMVCDVSRPAEIARVFADVGAELGGIDILVNNAGLGSHTLPADLDVAELDAVLRVNVTGYFFAAQAAHRSMRTRGGGRIVNVSSIAGATALGRGNVAYSISKAAINQLTRELAVEWAADGVRVNAVAPSQVRTEGFAPLLTDARLDDGSVAERMLRGVPMGRLAEPIEIAAVVHFLVSDAAAFVNGSVLPVDGGNLALNPGGTIGAQTTTFASRAAAAVPA